MIDVLVVVLEIIRMDKAKVGKLSLEDVDCFDEFGTWDLGKSLGDSLFRGDGCGVVLFCTQTWSFCTRDRAA